MSAPDSFVEMLQRSAEHLGRMQLGKFLVTRNLIRCHVVTETGEWAMDVDLVTADLPPDLLRRLWQIEVDLAAALAPVMEAQAITSLRLLGDITSKPSDEAQR